MKHLSRLVIACTVVMLAVVTMTAAKAAETIKIGLIEPLSGRIAAVGQDALHSFEYAAEQINRPAACLADGTLKSSASTTR